jgi:hypothetical protein
MRICLRIVSNFSDLTFRLADALRAAPFLDGERPGGVAL